MKKSHVEFIKISLLLFLLYKIISNYSLNNIEGLTIEADYTEAVQCDTPQKRTVNVPPGPTCTGTFLMSARCSGMRYKTHWTGDVGDTNCSDYYSHTGNQCENPKGPGAFGFGGGDSEFDGDCQDGPHCDQSGPEFVCDYDGNGYPGCTGNPLLSTADTIAATNAGCPGPLTRQRAEQRASLEPTGQ
jgi:hypothetical protein